MSNNNFKTTKLPKIKILTDTNLTNNAEELINQLGYNLKDCLLVSDKKIWQKYRQNFGKKFFENIGDLLILSDPIANQYFVNKILEFVNSNQLIIAFGSGTINDLCKYSSFLKQINYLVFSSAPSMNGYASANASISINNHKKTLKAHTPIAIFNDLNILKKSPIKMIKAGIADAICLYSCWFDWRLSNLVFKTEFFDQSLKMQHDLWLQLFKNYQKFQINDCDFIKMLIDILITSSQAMNIANGSYPASQSEHLIAHSLTMKYPKKLKNILHGQLIAITTKTSLELQKIILEKLQKKQLQIPIIEKKWQSLLHKFFGKKIALEAIEDFNQKNLSNLNINKINQEIATNYNLIYHELAKIYDYNQMVIKLNNHFKISHDIRQLKISKQQYYQAQRLAKYIRNRFSCLDFF
jgi:glycerol-1-phosphate dehydrogenase [NAD(P)+]